MNLAPADRLDSTPTELNSLSSFLDRNWPLRAGWTRHLSLVVPLPAKLSSILPKSALQDRSQPLRWTRASPLAVHSLAPPPFLHWNGSQPMGSLLLDCVESLQYPMGSALPIPGIWLGDQQSCHQSSAARQQDQRSLQIFQVVPQTRRAHPLEGAASCRGQPRYRLKYPSQLARP